MQVVSLLLFVPTACLMLVSCSDVPSAEGGAGVDLVFDFSGPREHPYEKGFESVPEDFDRQRRSDEGTDNGLEEEAAAARVEVGVGGLCGQRQGNEQEVGHRFRVPRKCFTVKLRDVTPALSLLQLPDLRFNRCGAPRAVGCGL